MNSATFISKRWFAPMSISVNGNVVPVLDNISAFLFFFSSREQFFLYGHITHLIVRDVNTI